MSNTTNPDLIYSQEAADLLRINNDPNKAWRLIQLFHDRYVEATGQPLEIIAVLHDSKWKKAVPRNQLLAFIEWYNPRYGSDRLPPANLLSGKRAAEAMAFSQSCAVWASIQIHSKRYTAETGRTLEIVTLGRHNAIDADQLAGYRAWYDANIRGQGAWKNRKVSKAKASKAGAVNEAMIARVAARIAAERREWKEKQQQPQRLLDWNFED